MFSWDLMLFWTMSREPADLGTWSWGRVELPLTACCFWPSISHISPLCEKSSFWSKNLKKPHFNKKQFKIVIIKDPKTLHELTSTNLTFFVQDLRFLHKWKALCGWTVTSRTRAVNPFIWTIIQAQNCFSLTCCTQVFTSEAGFRTKCQRTGFICKDQLSTAVRCFLINSISVIFTHCHSKHSYVSRDVVLVLGSS